MQTTTTSELLEPKNQAFYVAILAGGAADMYRWTRKRLRGEGIDLVIHWDPDARVTSVPGHVDFVLFFKEFAGKIEPQVMNAARRAGVPVIRTIRKWATMREDLEHHGVLGKCAALPEEGEAAVPAPAELEPEEAEQEAEKAIGAARARAEAAQAKADAERRRVEEERAAAAERARQHAERQKAMGIVLPAVPPLLAAREAELKRQEEADAEMAALALAAEGDDDDEDRALDPRRGSRRGKKEERMANVKDGAKTNGSPTPEAPATGPSAGLLLMLTKHLRAMGDDELVAAVPVATLARVVRALSDEALLAAAEGYAVKALESAFARPARRERAAAPAAVAPKAAAPAPARSSGREAPQRERVYRALAELAGTGACRVEQIRAHLDAEGNAINSCLRMLREEGRAFQAGWATSSRWALTQEAADRAVEAAGGSSRAPGSNRKR
jgi:hypothetical protein